MLLFHLGGDVFTFIFLSIFASSLIISLSTPGGCSSSGAIDGVFVSDYFDLELIYHGLYGNNSGFNFKSLDWVLLSQGLI